MSHKWTVTTVLATTLCLTTSIADAGCDEDCTLPDGEVCPDPAVVTTPACIRCSPDGSIALEVTVLGTDGLPLGDAPVNMIFSPSCEGLVSCESGLPPTVITAIADASGRAVFEPRLSGWCLTAGAVEFEAYGCNLGTYDSVASVDNDGDGIVALPDFVRFQSAFLDDDPRFDFSGCDDFVSLPDFVEFQQHFLAECP